MKTHKLTIKWKIFDCYNENQAKKMFEKLKNEKIKINVFDTETSTFFSAYLTDITLEKLDEFEIIIENLQNISRRKKNEIYWILQIRDQQKQKVTTWIIQNIIDEVLKLDN